MLLATWGKMYRTLASVSHHPFLIPMLLLKLSKYRQPVQLCAEEKGKDQGIPMLTGIVGIYQHFPGLMYLSGKLEQFYSLKIKRKTARHFLPLWKRSPQNTELLMCLNNQILAEFWILSFFMTKASLRQKNSILLQCCPEAKLAVWACISHYLMKNLG